MPDLLCFFCECNICCHIILWWLSQQQIFTLKCHNLVSMRLMVLHHWQYNISMYRFSDKTHFANGASINFLFWIPVLFFLLRLFYLSTSPLCNSNSSTSSLLVNFIIIYNTWFPSLSSLESPDSFPFASMFLAISCLSLDAVNAVYHVSIHSIQRKTLMMFIR